VAGLGRGGDDRGGLAGVARTRQGRPVDEPPQQRQAYAPAQQYAAEEESGSTRLVRPYTVTGGRTQPRYKLALEALVSSSVYEPRDLSVLAPECQAILQFCSRLALRREISAVLRMPLGVARILVADMSADGSCASSSVTSPRAAPTLICSKGCLVDSVRSSVARRTEAATHRR